MNGRLLRRLMISVMISCGVLSMLNCGRKSVTHRLEQINAVSSDNPDSALRLLEAINVDTLSISDRNLYNLLTIKAKDKMFVRHTSDTLINSIIEYYSHHQDEGWYAEALYYGGRVASDMGDYPTSLRRYQEALDLLPEDTPDKKLRGNVLSNVGWLLINIRLYEQSAQYVEEVIKLDSVLNDSINYLNDRYLLGQIYLRAKDYDKAEKIFSKNISLAAKNNVKYINDQYVQLAAIRYFKHDYESALELIRGISETTKEQGRMMAEAYAVRIYKKAGITDTAFYYAHRLIASNDYRDQKDGYQALLSEELRDLTPIDSIYSYIGRYVDLVEGHINRNANEETLLQNTSFNYQQHEKARTIADAKANRLKIELLVALCILLVLVTFTMLMRFRNKIKLLQLKNQIQNIQAILEDIKDTKTEDYIKTLIDQDETTGKNSKSQLVRKLREKLQDLCESTSYRKRDTYSIQESEAYKILLEKYIKKEVSIPVNDPVWSHLQDAIDEYNPNFKRNLYLLYGGNLDITDYHIAMLIKFGVTPTQLVFLVNKTKGTLSYRRKKLGSRIMNKELGAKDFDNIIHAL